MEPSQTDTSTVLTESRDVLYGDPSQDITLQNVYQLLINMNGRLTSIETGMTQVTQMNRTLSTLAKNFSELKTKVNEVESKVQKINVRCEKSESEISQIKTQHGNLDKQLKNLHVNNKEVNNNLQSLSDFMDDFKVKHDNNVKDVKQIRSSVSRVANDLDDRTTELRSEIKSALSGAREEHEELRNKVIDLQCRSMKNNLVFTGIQESEHENTEQVVKDFIRKELHISDWIELGNVHRFGSGARAGKRGRPRPIVTRFIFYKDLARVLSNTYRLKGKSFGVNQQFPDEIEQARKSLYPLMKKKRAEGCQVKLVRDILYVDGEIYNEERNVEDDIATNTQTDTKMSHTPDKNPVQKRKRTTTPKHC
ncbi:unnamed protein product [Mytilus edulis]|uniref:Uncharacterized protein n=2 Tax=Mytilus TaxID=6548 RepID=A0A8S3VAT9_MYTED|nr:unnamed protein product [Mytilus edulis]